MEANDEARVQVDRHGDVIVAGAEAQRMAVRAGFDARGQQEAGIIAQELASNMQKYAAGGTLTVRLLVGSQRGLEVRAHDRGPGIEDLETALEDGHSGPPTGAAGLPEGRPGRSLGVGLGAVRRLADELSIDSRPGGGTLVVARKFVPPPKRWGGR